MSKVRLRKDNKRMRVSLVDKMHTYVSKRMTHKRLRNMMRLANNMVYALKYIETIKQHLRRNIEIHSCC